MTEFESPVSMHGSDSQTLDNMLEWLLLGGMDMLQAMRILMPPATQSLEYKDTDLAAFYEYYGDQLRAVGRPRRRGHVRRPPRRLHARPQRPAPGALDC